MEQKLRTKKKRLEKSQRSFDKVFFINNGALFCFDVY